jgi:hypothetical protein
MIDVRRPTGGTIMRSSFKSAAFWLVVFLMASTQGALSQCRQNAHPVAVAIPGSLRSAQCFCDAGYDNVAGNCVRAANASPPANPATVQPPKR